MTEDVQMYSLDKSMYSFTGYTWYYHYSTFLLCGQLLLVTHLVGLKRIILTKYKMSPDSSIHDLHRYLRPGELGKKKLL